MPQEAQCRADVSDGITEELEHQLRRIQRGPGPPGRFSRLCAILCLWILCPWRLCVGVTALTDPFRRFPARTEIVINSPRPPPGGRSEAGGRGAGVAPGRDGAVVVGELAAGPPLSDGAEEDARRLDEMLTLIAGLEHADALEVSL